MNSLVLCPICKGEMTLRMARRGKNAGNQFWGCLKYPQCKGTLDYTETETVQNETSHSLDSVRDKESTKSSEVSSQNKYMSLPTHRQLIGMKQVPRDSWIVEYATVSSVPLPILRSNAKVDNKLLQAIGQTVFLSTREEKELTKMFHSLLWEQYY